MKNMSGVLQRLQRLAPPGVQPKFTNAAEWRAWQDAEARKRGDELATLNREGRLRRLMGRAGIQPLHQGCTFDNFRVQPEGTATGLEQARVVNLARDYVDNFDRTIRSFVFSGAPGTGKNHLAAAIANELIARGKTVLVATVLDLMGQIRDTYNGNGLSEAKFIDHLSRLDLLIIDEVGVQRGSTAENVVLNQLLDKR